MTRDTGNERADGRNTGGASARGTSARDTSAGSDGMGSTSAGDGGGRDLRQAREAARGTERAARQLVEFADRLGDDIGPADMAEFDTLVAHETSAISERVEAFERLGLTAGSIDATGPSVDLPI